MKKNKGFTLIELLVTISILGIIMGISLPLISNLQENNKNRKYDMYAESMLQSAKLYQDSYSEDLFGYRKTGCAIVTLQDLIDKKLIKDYTDDNMSCNNNDVNSNNQKSLVRIVKIGKKYGYSYQLFCGKKGEDNKLKNPQLLSASDSERVKKYSKTNEETTSSDFDSDLCNSTGKPIITVDPNTGNKPEKKYSVTIKLSSFTGIATSPNLLDIEYTWLSMNSKNQAVGDNFDHITNWKKLNFTIPSKSTQEKKLINNSAKPITATLKKKVPKELGWYYLVIKPNKFVDLGGSEMVMDQQDYIIAGYYNVANIYNLTYDSAEGSACEGKKITEEKGEIKNWGILCRPKRKGYVFTGWKDAKGNTISDNADVNADLNLKATWRKSKVIIKYHINNGQLASAHGSDITVKDGVVYSSGNAAFHTIEYGGTVGSSGLIDYNNPNYLNIRRDNYTITAGSEWNTKANGSGTSYNQANANYKHSDFCNADYADCTADLYANWKIIQHKITYIGNGNDSGSTGQTICNHNQDCYLAGNGFDKVCHSFNGWYNSDSGGNKYGATVKLTSDITVYAHWSLAYAYKNNSNNCYNSIKDAISGTGNGGTITLLKDYSDSSAASLSSNKNITFDAGGKTLNLTSHAFSVSKGTLTVRNGTINTSSNTTYAIKQSGGTINIESGATIHSKCLAKKEASTEAIYMNGGTLNLNGGTISGGEGGKSIYARIMSMEGGTFNMNSGTLKANATKGSYGANGIKVNNSNAKANIKGGTIEINKGGPSRCAVCCNGGTIKIKKGVNINVKGGSSAIGLFYSAGSICYEKGVKLNIAANNVATYNNSTQGTLSASKSC